MVSLRAEDKEPQAYFFWSQSCPYSQAARSFLQSAQRKDPSLRVRDFEVDQSPSNTLLLGKVYERIGLPEFWVVPLTVIGHHVIIGYIHDDTTGQEILDDVAKCRKAGCRDTMQDLIDAPPSVDQASAVTFAAPIACERRDRYVE